MGQKYKILIYLGVVILVGLILYVIWTAFVPKPTVPVTPTPAPSSGSLPVTNGTSSVTTGTASQAASSTITVPILSKISSHDVFTYWVDPQTGDVRYMDNTGEVWLVNQGGKETLDSGQTLTALNSADVYQNKQEVLVSFGDPAAPQWAIYDVLDQTWHSLPQNIVNVTWGADPNQLIGLVKNVNSYSLSYVDLTKTPATEKTILNNFYMNGVNFKFLAPSTLIITEKPSSYYSASAWELNLKNLAMNMVFQPTAGLYARTSSDGSLIFSYSGNNITILNSKTLAPYNLPFQSLPGKCDSSANASSSSIYCFSPENVTPSVVMPDDYLEKAFYSIDILYNYSFNTQNTKTVIISGTPGIPMIDAENVSSYGGSVYFVNRYDNSLYKLTLPSVNN